MKASIRPHNILLATFKFMRILDDGCWILILVFKKNIACLLSLNSLHRLCLHMLTSAVLIRCCWACPSDARKLRRSSAFVWLCQPHFNPSYPLLEAGPFRCLAPAWSARDWLSNPLAVGPGSLHVPTFGSMPPELSLRAGDTQHCQRQHGKSHGIHAWTQRRKVTASRHEKARRRSGGMRACGPKL